MNIQHWIQSSELKNIQSQLTQGQVPVGCSVCVRQEKTQGHSLRTESLRDYGQQYFTDTDIDFVDYRASNICNFKCRSCNPEFSHGIAQEVKTHPKLEKFFKSIDSKSVAVTDTNQEWILNNLSQLNRLMLTGGEPTVMPGIKEIINEVATNHADRINILITTNGSFTDVFWKDITKKIKNLHWTVSIDAIGDAAAIVRHGTDWSQVESNVNWLAEHSTSLNINTVISNLNVLQLMPVLKFVRDIQKHRLCRHQFFKISRPNWLAADNWPPELIPRIKQYLDQCLSQDLDTEQNQTISALLEQINASIFSLTLWNQSTMYNQELDRIRKQDHISLFDTV
jgi:sulfatase maturation enzyme AslB (radical SAM superfamily)